MKFKKVGPNLDRVIPKTLKMSLSLCLVLSIKIWSEGKQLEQLSGQGSELHLPLSYKIVTKERGALGLPSTAVDQLILLA